MAAQSSLISARRLLRIQHYYYSFYYCCYLLSLSTWIQESLAECAPYPVRAPIANVTLSNNNIARGIALSVGSPEQHFAFLPQWPLNNTFVYGTNGRCSKSWTDSSCTTFRGGQYDEFASASRGGLANPDAYPKDGSQYPDCNWVTDNLVVNSNSTLGDFPIGIALEDAGLQGYHPQAALGLGPNSTVLNTLKNAGQIMSRSWAMFWGRTGATKGTQMDGNFVFGGYDRAKVSGASYTQDLVYNSNPSCLSGMLVTVTDIVLNFSNGTSASLFDGAASTAMSACLLPDFPVLMTIPLEPYFQRFQQFTGANDFGRSFGIYYYGMIYNNLTQIYSGDLTISLSSGLSVRIPNDQLIAPELTIDDSGSISANSSAPELLLNSIQQINANDLPLLGRQFLSSAYLMVNQDAGKFTLWAANPTTHENLVAVDSSNQPITEFCDGTADHSNSTATPGISQNNTNRSHGGLTTRAIAGIAVGCAVGLAFTIGILFFLFMKKKQKTQLLSPGFPPGNYHDATEWVGYGIGSKSVQGHHSPRHPVELQGKPKLQVSGVAELA